MSYANLIIIIRTVPIHSSDLIKRHKDVLSQLTETQTRLVSTEKGARGLKAELHVLHQVRVCPLNLLPYLEYIATKITS